MKIIDLTQPIHPAMPVYPGTEPPLIEKANTVEKDGFLEHRMTMYTHTGTHMDAPSHIFEGTVARNLDDFPVDHFVGKACIIDTGNDNPVPLRHILGFEKIIASSQFVILRTGWSRYWGTGEYFGGYHSLEVEAAEWISSFDLRGVGIDAISVDPIDSFDLPVHRRLLSKNILIIENLTNLNRLDSSGFIFACLPLAVQNADGAPARAIAMVE